MLGWLSLFGLVPKWVAWFGPGSRGFANMIGFVSAVALMGAFSGGLSGAAVAIFGRDAPRALPRESSRPYLRPAVARHLDLIGLGFIAVAASWIAVAHGSSNPSLGFYRFKAGYEVLETGEKINFDVVRPCDLKIIDQSDRDFFFGGKGFPKVTSRGHAIIVTLPRACSGQTTANDGVPADLLPFAAWFEDADDLSFGLQYTGKDAYEGPHAKIRFLGATIENANATDFKDWKRQAGEDFRPSKRVTNPFGFQQVDWGFGPNNIPSDCFGVKRIPLPENLRELARAAWPEEHPRFWALPMGGAPLNKSEEALEKAALSAKATMFDGLVFGNRYRYTQFNWNEWSQSSPTPASGAFLEPKARPVDIFPVTFNSYGAPFVLSGDAERRRGSIEVTTAAEWSGFTACYSRSLFTPLRVRRSLGDLGTSGLAWIVDGEDVRAKPTGRAAPVLPDRFLERDEFVYFRAEGPIR